MTSLIKPKKSNITATIAMLRIVDVKKYVTYYILPDDSYADFSLRVYWYDSYERIYEYCYYDDEVRHLKDWLDDLDGITYEIKEIEVNLVDLWYGNSLLPCQDVVELS